MADQFQEKEKVDKIVETSDADSNESLITRSTSDKTGKTILHYDVLTMIGKGGMSTVYKAHHNILDRPVAIKFILPKLVHDERSLMRFKQEAQAATELHHPNICAVKEFGVDEEGSPYIVMDYVEGHSLKDEIEKNGPLKPDRALALLKQVCQGIQHAHSKGVVHRDLKPENLILVEEKDGSEGIRIVDFGIAKLINDEESGKDLTKTGDIFGTPSYMSPEQCMGQKVDTRSDIYSIGCVLFNLLTGRAPFDASSALEILMKQVNDNLENLNDIPSSVNQIIQHATEKDKNQRYDSAGSLIKDIESYQSGSNIVYRTGNRNRTKVMLIAFGAATAITAVGGLMAFFNVYHSSPSRTNIPVKQQNTIRTNIPVQDYQFAQNSPWSRKHKEADLAHRTKNTEKALQLYLEARDLAIKGNAPKRDLGFLNYELGGCARYLKEDQLAVNAYQKAADIYKSINDLDNYQRCLGGLARSEFSLHQYQKGLKHYDEVLSVQQKLFGNSPNMIAYQQVVGKAYLDAGKFQEAIAHFEKAFQIGDKYPGQNQQDLALAHWYSGKALLKIGDKAKAIENFNQAERLGRFAWLDDNTLHQIKEDISKAGGK